jgi:phage protein D
VFNYLDIQFPTLDAPVSKAATFNHSHARYEHEVVKVYFSEWSVPYDSIVSGTPISVGLYGLGSSKTINGYIHHIEPDISPEKNYVEVTIIGASYVFKQQSQQVWVNVTASQVVSDIATKNGFSYDCIPSERVYDQISQAGMSDWELMVNLAKQNGYSLKCDNATVIFHPLTQAFTDLRAQAAYYIMNGLNEKRTGIYSFKPLVGEAIPFNDAKKASVATSGVDRTNATEHQKTNQKGIVKTRRDAKPVVFDSYQTNVVAPTFEIAQYEANAADERNRYAYRGVATIQGSPNLLPDAPIYLDGVGSIYSGFWTVLSVEHHVEKEVFTTTIEIGTDSLGLAAKWTDNKDILAPEQSVKRVISSGVRQKNIVPRTVLKKSGSSYRKNSSSHFSVVKNVAKIQTIGSPSHKWVGTSGNVRQTPFKDVKMPPAVLHKKLSNL